MRNTVIDIKRQLIADDNQYEIKTIQATIHIRRQLMSSDYWCQVDNF